MKTTTDEAANLRAALKAKGFSSRQVSVRADYYSMGSTLRVQIKDARVPFVLVKRLAEAKERIDRDQFGEILSGGNRYVSISLTAEAAKAKAAPYLEAVQKAAEKLPEGETTYHEAINERFSLCRGNHGYGWALWGRSSFIVQRNELESIALEIAVQMETPNGREEYSGL